jgi:hypothetical protein
VDDLIVQGAAAVDGEHRSDVCPPHPSRFTANLHVDYQLCRLARLSLSNLVQCDNRSSNLGWQAASMDVAAGQRICSWR